MAVGACFKRTGERVLSRRTTFSPAFVEVHFVSFVLRKVITLISRIVFLFLVNVWRLSFN